MKRKKYSQLAILGGGDRAKVAAPLHDTTVYEFTICFETNLYQVDETHFFINPTYNFLYFSLLFLIT
jgi:hypothetical protein